MHLPFEDDTRYSYGWRESETVFGMFGRIWIFFSNRIELFRNEQATLWRICMLNCSRDMILFWSVAQIQVKGQNRHLVSLDFNWPGCTGIKTFKSSFFRSTKFEIPGRTVVRAYGREASNLAFFPESRFRFERCTIPSHSWSFYDYSFLKKHLREWHDRL